MDALAALDNLARNLRTPSRLETIGGMAAEMIRSHIHKGEGFEPLSPATVAYRGAGRPLQDTGGLRDSIGFKVINGSTVSVGTDKPYAAVQNNGGVIRPKNKEWLWVPGPGIRQIERDKKGHGWGPTNVLKTLKGRGCSIFRIGRTIRYWKKGEKRPKNPWDYPIAYYLKKSVEIKARKFFYLSDRETVVLMQEAGSALEQL